MQTLLQNIRYGARALWKTPGFTLTALVTLALCIGANLSIFAVVDAVLLRPLPFLAPDQLVTIFNTYPKAGVERDGSSLTNYYERRGNIAAFSTQAIYRESTAIIGERGTTQRQPIMKVAPEFFATLGRNPVIGRAFKDEETTYQTDGEVILSDAYWRQNFNADPNVLGREIRVDGLQKKVIGVLPPDFQFLSSTAQLYFPLASNPVDRVAAQRHSGSSTNMIARLKPGATIAEAQAQIDAHNAAVADSYPQAKMIAEAGFRSVILSLRADHTASIRPILLLLQAGVGFLLLIGSVNLVNLLLIRASNRTKEFAIRQSLGASRRHIISQVMTEILLLTLSGGALGLFVAVGGLKLLTVLGADQLPLGAQIAFDQRLALTALTGAVVMGIVIALPIAVYSLQAQLAAAMQSEGRSGTPNRAAQRLRHGFIVAQIALALILLTGAGLLGLGFKRLLAISPGFSSENVLSGQVSLPFKNYPNASARIQFAEKVIEAVKQQPGVKAVGISSNIPFSGNNIKSAVTPAGFVPQPGESVRGHYSYGVAGDYFVVLGIPLRAGRFLENDDLLRPQGVCVVDEDFARRYWPQRSAIGQRVFKGSQAGKDAEAFTIVGVVGAVKQAELTENEAQGTVYFPYNNYYDRLFVVTRTIGRIEVLGTALQNIVRNIDPELPVNDLRTMDIRISESLIARRSSALLIVMFAGVALLLTAIGTYGVLSYAVAQRRREIGIRLALGAEPKQVRQQFLSLGLRLLAFGTAIGIAGAGLAGGLIRHLLVDVPAFNLAILFGTVVTLTIVSLTACWLPARRVAEEDPMVALRCE